MKCKIWICTLLFGIIFLNNSCGKESTHAGVVSPMSIKAAKDTIYAGSDKTISVNLKIENYDKLQRLIISKSSDAENSYIPVRTLPASELKGNHYDYIYQLQANDSKKITLLFTLIGTDGKKKASTKVLIDRRTGLFPIYLKCLSRVTGGSLGNENFPNPTPTTNWTVGGTDLGIMWDMENGKTGLFFGDSYGNDFRPVGGGPGAAGQWRYNVLAISEDKNLDDGLSISQMATLPNNNSFARQIIDKAPGSHTAIPAGAIHIKGVDYVHYWNLQSWDNFVTNFASLYKSADHGKTWSRCAEVLYAPRSKFTCAAYAKKDGYVYMIGTRVLRNQEPYLARFAEADILNQKNYEYWNGTSWIKDNENAAIPLFRGGMGEASLKFSESLKIWMLTYLGNRDIEIRYAKSISGPWSEPQILVKASEYSGLYGAFIHPQSKGDIIYFNMSLWAPYNVFFMKAKLKYIEP